MTASASTPSERPTPLEAEHGGASAEQLADWMRRYQAGDAEAFGHLYDALLPSLRRYVLSLCRERGRGDELLQEALLQLHRSRHTYQPSRPVLPWAFGVARHVVLMSRRGEGRAARVFAPHDGDLVELPVPPVAASLGARDAVRQAVARLPAEQREPLLLHHVWGFSFAEIGHILGLRAGTAKVRSHRGMRQLRETLGGTSA